MNSLALTLSSSASTLCNPNRSLDAIPSPLTTRVRLMCYFNRAPRQRSKRGRRNGGICKAAGGVELSSDAPVAFAIGACILHSLLFPVSVGPEEEDDQEDDASSLSLIASTDVRLAAMGIIGFIPFFNWLSWIFAWMDTGKQRYAVYAIVYMAPYLRSNFSLSPEESWLPLASILFCIVHIQLEASIRNGDLQGFQFFNQAAKNISSITEKKSGRHGTSKGELEETRNLPSAHEHLRDEIRGWGTSRETFHYPEHSNEDGDAEKGIKH
ncbi:hypothetical protein RJ641_001458 [Dillenia turbinata]|uniref:Uncharacterized protein n=1 Tax=Dillenia turbinata TaxID=194707 RepID=A0AAN8ZWT4_9MAGN